MLEYKEIIISVILSFVIALIIGPFIISLLRKLNIGQSIREEGPESHLSKSGTPTMGGIIIFAGLLISVLTSGVLNKDMYILLLSTLGFGLIGFVDDYIIVAKKRNLGLRAYQKIIAQVILAVILAIYQSKASILGTKVIIPFLKNQYLDLGVLYIPFPQS